MSKKGYFLTAAVIVVGCAVFYSWGLSKPKFNEVLSGDIMSQVEVAPINEALTLALSHSSEVLLVLDASAKGVKAIDVNAVVGSDYGDAADAFLALGRDRLVEIAATESPEQYLWENISVPLVVEEKKVAAGTNYSEHADEVGLTGEPPFLFPKLSNTTRWNASVTSGSRLDYEVELCAVPLQDYRAGDKTQLAYVLCGDFTDRWLLIKDMDLAGEMGKTGFPLGKGGGTRLPIGPFLVIPSNADFYNNIDLKLYVDDDLRQHSMAGLMIWSPWEIMQNALDDCGSVYTREGEEIKILSSCEKIPAKTLFLTGTPEGVMFHLATMWNSAFYLQSGDVVSAHATYLGVTRNVIQ